MFRYLSSTLPHLPSKRGVCKALLLSSSSAPLDTWQPDEFDLSLIQESSTEEADDTLSALLDWSVQWEFQRTKRGAANQDSSFDHQFEEYKVRQKAPPLQGWPVQALQNFSVPLLPESELKRRCLSQQPAAAAPVAARESANHSSEKGRFLFISGGTVYYSTPITAGQATDDRCTLVTASSPRECKVAGLADVSQFTSVPHSSLTSLSGSTAMEEAPTTSNAGVWVTDGQTRRVSFAGLRDDKKASALEGWSVKKDSRVCRNRDAVWPTRIGKDKGVKLINSTLLKMNGVKVLNRQKKELVRRILRFAKREIRLHEDSRERESLHGRIKDWVKKWVYQSLDLYGQECEVEFYLTVGRPSLFCQRWFASCTDGNLFSANRLTEIMEMEDFILEIYGLLRDDEVAIFDDFQVKVSQKFCTMADSSQADRALALVVMRNFTYRLLKVLSAEMSGMPTREDRHKFLKACLDLLVRILATKTFQSPWCHNRNCPHDECSDYQMWFELLSPPLGTESDNLYIRAFEELVSPHVAAEIRTDLLAQSEQKEALTQALQEWMRMNDGEGSFSNSIERVARRKQTSLKPRKTIKPNFAKRKGK